LDFFLNCVLGSLKRGLPVGLGITDGTAMGTIKGEFESSRGFPQIGTATDKATREGEGLTLGVLTVAARDDIAMGTALGVFTGAIRTAGVVAEGTILGIFAGAGSPILVTPDSFAKGPVGTNGTTIGFLVGSMEVNLKVIGNQLGTEGMVEMSTTLGVLAGTVSTGRAPVIALESQGFTLAGRREISIDSRLVGVISNDASSKTVRSGGTAVATTSNGSKAGVATSGGGTAASSGTEWAPSIGGLSDGRVGRSIRGGITRNVLVHLPRGIFLNKSISNLPGARLWGSTGVSTDSATRVVGGRLPPRHAYAIAHHAWNSMASAGFMVK
jgi:hypothetical protein